MRFSGMAFALALVGCGGKDECAAGFALNEDDGLCYEQGASTEVDFEALLDSLPPCTLAEPDGALDLVDYCAGPGCFDDTFSELQDAYGPADECISIGGERAECTWSAWGVVGNYVDTEGDGVIGDNQTATGLYVGRNFPGATSEGLSPDVSISCFVEKLGLPTWVEPIEVVDGQPFLAWWAYHNGAFFLVDRFDDLTGAQGSDGMPEYVWLNGPG